MVAAVSLLALILLLAVPAYAWAVRGRTYGIFAFVILIIALPGALAVHARLSDWVPADAPPLACGRLRLRPARRGGPSDPPRARPAAAGGIPHPGEHPGNGLHRGRRAVGTLAARPAARARRPLDRGRWRNPGVTALARSGAGRRRRALGRHLAARRRGGGARSAGAQRAGRGHAHAGRALPLAPAGATGAPAAAHRADRRSASGSLAAGASACGG